MKAITIMSIGLSANSPLRFCAMILGIGSFMGKGVFLERSFVLAAFAVGVLASDGK